MKPKQQQFFTLILITTIVALMGYVIINPPSKKSDPIPTQTSRVVSSAMVETPAVTESGIIIYYGITCPYCKDVDEWIEKNNAEDSLEITHKEVYQNKDNSNELMQVATSCGLNINNVGVPFMFANGQCYSGKFEIIDYLQQQLEEKNTE